MNGAVTQDDIVQASKRIEGFVHQTPVMRVKVAGHEVDLKFESMQPTGSFKVRGAFNALLASDVPKAGIVAASGGNHGAAVAFAAKKLGHKATIFVPELAGPSKIALIEQTGADLYVVPGVYADALALAESHEQKTGAMQLHAYDAPLTVAGQGTVLREWEHQGLEADTLLIAVGGGGLIAGALAWNEDRRNIIAIEPELAPTLSAALMHGPDTMVDVSGIAANALGARKIGRICYDLAKAQNTECFQLSDEIIIEAQQYLWQNLRQWVEPAGAAALGAVLSGAYSPEKDERLAVLICGANPATGPFD